MRQDQQQSLSITTQMVLKIKWDEDILTTAMKNKMKAKRKWEQQQQIKIK